MAKIIFYICIVCCLSFTTVLSGQGYHPSHAVEQLQELRKVIEAEVGNTETGWNTGPEIDKYFEVSEFSPGVAYCSIFIMWGYEQIGVVYCGTPWSPSWFIEATTIYQRGSYTFYTPRFGDAFGIYFRSKGRVAHVGFILAWMPETGMCLTLEGNTNSGGSREGDGIFIRSRKISEIYQVARFIW